MKTLPGNFYVHPTLANMTVGRKDLKELLMATGGSVMVRGKLWNIKTKHLAAGVYRVTIERKKYKYNN